MGIMVVVLTLPLFLIHFPMWGSMLMGPREGAQEEDYYLHEWSAEEVAQGLHQGSMRFAMESKSQRGHKQRKLDTLDADDDSSASTKNVTVA